MRRYCESFVVSSRKPKIRRTIPYCILHCPLVCNGFPNTISGPDLYRGWVWSHLNLYERHEEMERKEHKSLDQVSSHDAVQRSVSPFSSTISRWKTCIPNQFHSRLEVLLGLALLTEKSYGFSGCTFSVESASNPIRHLTSLVVESPTCMFTVQLFANHGFRRVKAKNNSRNVSSVTKTLSSRSSVKGLRSAMQTEFM